MFIYHTRRIVDDALVPYVSDLLSRYTMRQLPQTSGRLLRDRLMEHNSRATPAIDIMTGSGRSNCAESLVAVT